MDGQLLSAAWTVIIAVAIIFAGLVGVGFWLIARRKNLRHAPNALDSLQQNGTGASSIFARSHAIP